MISHIYNILTMTSLTTLTFNNLEAV
jgi:hypothetical protein